MTPFQVQEHDGTLTSVSHKDFFGILNSSENYLYYKRGGTHIAMLPSTTNEAALRLCRQAENRENYTHSMDTRCRDAKGHICRYQHDEHGRIIRNAAGNPVSAKCIECPRDGWIGGRRENCCIRFSCKIEDCSRCNKHREYHAPISLEWLTEDKYDNDECAGAGYTLIDPGADVVAILESDELHYELHTAIINLPIDEQLVINAIFWEKLSQRVYALESGLSRRKVSLLYNSAIETLKRNLRDFY